MDESTLRFGNSFSAKIRLSFAAKSAVGNELTGGCRRHHGADLREDRADAGRDARHDGAGRNCDKARH